MAIEDVVSRVAAIEDMVARVEAATAPPGARVATATRTSSATGTTTTAFGSALDQATAAGSASLSSVSPEQSGLVLSGTRTLQGVTDPTTLSVATTPGQRALAAAQAEVGVREEPDGSNDGARIAEYRTATAGSAAGVPWCAYFVSWAARQAGAPVGDQGQGYGAVEQIASWAGRTGRLLPAGSTPQPGDLILFGGRHVGIVESVGLDGRLTTVEGNHQNAVQRVQRTIGDATGFVRLG
jgi:hypothetical protein